MSSNYLIECSNLIANTASSRALTQGIDLKVESGEIIVLTGAEKSGKNDWLKTMSGIFYPVSGSINYFGKNSRKFSNDERSQLREKIAYVTTDVNLLSVINGLANVMLPAIYHKLGTIDEIRDIALDLISELGIDDGLELLPADMHNEQRFLLMVARSLMLKPRILFLEKPFCSLDTVSSEHFKNFLKHLAKQKNTTIIISTQDINFIRQYADQVVYVSLDKLFSFASADDFLNCNHTQITTF
ncbi:MAG: ATP-binding cassette domain-containing protein, partial [Thiotrichaceae bacterium]|nr:ATP-binding cassette domain-containing protein [Thiotrichaceae bacterium]